MSSDATKNEPDTDEPSVRQLLHAATGDRDAEAAALADRSDEDVTDEEAKVAVERAHGDMAGKPKPEGDIASPQDAEAAREDLSDVDQ